MKTKNIPESVIPSGFESFQLDGSVGSFSYENIKNQNKELVLISAPAEFDINKLKGEQIVLNGSKLLCNDQKDSDETSLKWELHSFLANSDKHLNVLLPSETEHKHVMTNPLSLTINVVRDLQIPIFKSPQKKIQEARLPKPVGLKTRWVPFGAESPISCKNMHSTDEMMDIGEECGDISEKNSPDKKKKKKKKTVIEFENKDCKPNLTILDEEINVPKNDFENVSLGESGVNLYKKKKKKKKNVRDIEEATRNNVENLTKSGINIKMEIEENNGSSKNELKKKKKNKNKSEDTNNNNIDSGINQKIKTEADINVETIVMNEGNKDDVVEKKKKKKKKKKEFTEILDKEKDTAVNNCNIEGIERGSIENSFEHNNNKPKKIRKPKNQEKDRHELITNNSLTFEMNNGQVNTIAEDDQIPSKKKKKRKRKSKEFEQVNDENRLNSNEINKNEIHNLNKHNEKQKEKKKKKNADATKNVDQNNEITTEIKTEDVEIGTLKSIVDNEDKNKLGQRKKRGRRKSVPNGLEVDVKPDISEIKLNGIQSPASIDTLSKKRNMKRKRESMLTNDDEQKKAKTDLNSEVEEKLIGVVPKKRSFSS